MGKSRKALKPCDFKVFPDFFRLFHTLRTQTRKLPHTHTHTNKCKQIQTNIYHLTIYSILVIYFSKLHDCYHLNGQMVPHAITCLVWFSFCIYCKNYVLCYYRKCLWYVYLLFFYGEWIGKNDDYRFNSTEAKRIMVPCYTMYA